MQTTATTPNTNINAGLSSKALIVNFSLSQWSGRKYDKELSNEIADNHNAKKDRARVNKLLVDKSFLEKYQQIGSAAYIYHRKNTLPWGDNGDRILPSANYFEYVREMNFFKSQAEQAVKETIAEYLSQKEKAKIEMNGMYNEADYPTVTELESKYKLAVSFMPLPDIDFRLDIGQTEINNLTKQVEAAYSERINAAVSDVWKRIKEHLLRMRDTLQVQDKIFRDTLFDNLRDMIDLLPKLNVTNDANIDAICREMVNLVQEPDNVRKNTTLRAKTAQDVNDILNKFNDFFTA